MQCQQETIQTPYILLNMEADHGALAAFGHQRSQSFILDIGYWLLRRCIQGPLWSIIVVLLVFFLLLFCFVFPP